jgi:hypothetical protein
MVNRVLVAITLVCFVTTNVRCTRYSRYRYLSSDEVRELSYVEVRSINPFESIAGVGLKSGRLIMFRDDTGVYNHGSLTISGTVTDGAERHFALDGLAYVVTESRDIRGVVLSQVDASSFLRESQEHSWTVVDGRSVRPGDEIVFGDRACVYDAEKGVISLPAADTEFVEVPLSEISGITERQMYFSRSELNPATIVNVPLYILLPEASDQRITSLVCGDGTRIEYDSRGGAYNPDNNTVSGRSVDGSVLSIKIKDMVQLESVSTVLGDTLRSIERTDDFVVDVSNHEIVGVITKSKVVYNFVLKYGRVNLVARTISGRAMGQAVEIPFADVHYVQIGPEPQSSATQVLVLAVACAAIAGLIYLLTTIDIPPPDWGGGGFGQ